MLNKTMVYLTPTELGLTLALSVIILINLLGNGLVCLVVLRYRNMRGPINYLLVNLALADILVALSITPQYVIKWTFHHPNGTAGDYMCKFITGGSFIWIGGQVSAFSLVVIAAERYWAVVRPLDGRSRLTTRRLIAVVTAGWIFALLYNLPLFFVVRHNTDGGSNDQSCTEKWPKTNLAKAFTVACFCVYGAIPISTMVCLYSRVLYKLWKGGIRATQLSEQARIRARLKVTKMVVVVSIMYAVCWLPNLVTYMLSKFKPKLLGNGSYFYSVPFVISVVLVGLNSAMNPFIYTLHSTKFRQFIWLAITCREYRPIDFIDATTEATSRQTGHSSVGNRSGEYFADRN